MTASTVSTKPDTDNLQKMLKDCMTKCYFWQDDALVASELFEKFWVEIPGIFVRIEVLDSVELCAAFPAGEAEFRLTAKPHAHRRCLE